MCPTSPISTTCPACASTTACLTQALTTPHMEESDLSADIKKLMHHNNILYVVIAIMTAIIVGLVIAGLIYYKRQAEDRKSGLDTENQGESLVQSCVVFMYVQRVSIDFQAYGLSVWIDSVIKKLFTV